VDLLEKGKYAVRYEIETIDGKTNKVTKIAGDIEQTSNQSVCSAAVKNEFKKIEDTLATEKDALNDGKLTDEEL